jgi:hypothetical protein
MHRSNAPIAKIVTPEPRSNVTVERETQLPKTCSEIAVTDEGMQIDRSEAQCRKDMGGRTESRDFGSNATIDRTGEQKKQLFGTVSADEGTQTLRNRGYWAAGRGARDETGTENPEEETTLRGRNHSVVPTG